MTEIEHNEATLTEAIRRTWPSHFRSQPRYVMAVQVRDGAGFSAMRTLDAIVFDTWPSKGLELHGLEIKTTTADLRRELSNPKKFGRFEPLLDRFSIVAPLGVVDLSLLPKRWGLYCPTDGGKLRARRKPLPLRPGTAPPATIDRSFAASFVRALVDRSLNKTTIQAEYDRGYQRGQASKESDVERAEKRVEEIRQRISTFEENSGVKLDPWNAGRIGEAVKLILNGGIKHRISYRSSIRGVGERMIELANELDALDKQFSGDK